MKQIQHGPHTLIVMAVFLLLSCSGNDKEIIIEPGTGIQHDDFEYSVLDHSLQKFIATNEDTVTTDGNFYIVTFKVVNMAVRVDHEWDNSIAYIIGDDGTVYENKTTLQKKLDETRSFGFQESYVTHFQSSDSTILVFELPPTVKNPYLMVRGETLMGDFFNGNRFKRTKVKLF